MKRVLVALMMVLIAVIVAGGLSGQATAIPAPTYTIGPLPTSTPTYEVWDPGQSGYFLCVNGWATELTGQSVHPVCKTGNAKAMSTPEPGHYLWQPGQHGYFLCPFDWQYEEYGQSMLLTCPESDGKNEK